MARKPRIDEDGGLYHVLNRGNYRRWILKREDAKQTFGGTLFESYEQAKSRRRRPHEGAADGHGWLARCLHMVGVPFGTAFVVGMMTGCMSMMLMMMGGTGGHRSHTGEDDDSKRRVQR
jgi:predicted phage tail protein